MILLIRKKLRTKASFGKHRLRNSSIAWETDFYKFQDFFKISFKEFRNIVPFVQIIFFAIFKKFFLRILSQSLSLIFGASIKLAGSKSCCHSLSFMQMKNECCFR